MARFVSVCWSRRRCAVAPRPVTIVPLGAPRCTLAQCIGPRGPSRAATVYGAAARGGRTTFRRRTVRALTRSGRGPMTPEGPNVARQRLRWLTTLTAPGRDGSLRHGTVGRRCRQTTATTTCPSAATRLQPCRLAAFEQTQAVAQCVYCGEPAGGSSTATGPANEGTAMSWLCPRPS